MQSKIYLLLKISGILYIFNILLHKRSYNREIIVRMYWKFIHKLNLFFKPPVGYEVKKLTSNVVNLFYEKNSVFMGVSNDVIAFGKSNIIIRDKFAYINKYIDIDNELLPEENNNILSLDKKIIFKEGKRDVIKIEEGVLFTDRLSSNYAHWVTEVLTRISLYCRNSKITRNIPLIVDNYLPDSMYESIRMVDSSREIIKVEEDQELRIRKCTIVSPTGYVPYNYRKKSKAITNGYFNEEAMLGLRNAVLKGINQSNTLPKKIYVGRYSNYRKLINQTEIEKMLISNGYSIINPETLTFLEQIELFNSAEHIIGPTGAGMTNIMFTKTDCVIDVLFSKSTQHAYQYWENIATCSGNKVRCIIGTIAHNDYIHSDFKVPLSKIQQAIKM